MAKSKIEWTDFTWNTITGCTRVSQGCVNCYAETQSPLLKARYEGTARKAAKKWASDPRTKLLPEHVQAAVSELSGGETNVVKS